jgi:hypothetical protein
MLSEVATESFGRRLYSCLFWLQNQETEMAKKPHADDEENQIDGCDLDFTQIETTPDAELPAAKGGVEPAPRSSRSAKSARRRTRAASARATRSGRARRKAKRK